MKADQNKQLDNFIKKVVSEAGVEEPSSSFTETVMQNIQRSELKTPETGKKPLINKYIWIAITIIIIGACSISLLGDWETNYVIPYVGNISELNFINALNSMDLSLMDNINIHNNVVYAVLMLSIFFYIQMLLLERRVKL